MLAQKVGFITLHTEELKFIANETLTTCTAGKLRLGYPESITPEEIPF